MPAGSLAQLVLADANGVIQLASVLVYLRDAKQGFVFGLNFLLAHITHDAQT